MPNAAIVIDKWKLGIFERNLQQSGYTYVRSLGLSDGTLILTVTTDNMVALQEVVQQASDEATKSKGLG